MFVSLPLCLPEEVFNAFSFLRNMFSNEFILSPGATVQVRNWNQSGAGKRKLTGQSDFMSFVMLLASCRTLRRPATCWARLALSRLPNMRFW